MRKLMILVTGVNFAVLLIACSHNGDKLREVIIYTSVDQHYAEPILKTFEAKTGIRVKALYDVEAAKTTGLVKRLIAEANNPRSDVFWNSEPLQTNVLHVNNILASYSSPALRADHKHDSQGTWTSFGGRARVFIINPTRLKKQDWPKSLFDLGSDKWNSERTVIAYPLFGTSATHATALYAKLGQSKARSFYDRLLKQKVRIVDGNAAVREMVVSGRADFGLTDTDDACNAVQQKNAPIAVVFPDQGDTDIGTLIIPNTVSLIARGPNPKSGKMLIDYLLSKSVADKLSQTGWFHINGTEVIAPEECGLPSQVKPMSVNYTILSHYMGDVVQDLRNRILR